MSGVAGSGAAETNQSLITVFIGIVLIIIGVFVLSYGISGLFTALNDVATDVFDNVIPIVIGATLIGAGAVVIFLDILQRRIRRQISR